MSGLSHLEWTEVLFLSRGQRPEMLLNIPNAQDSPAPTENFLACNAKNVEVMKSWSKA